jgi:hypothetical protein
MWYNSKGNRRSCLQYSCPNRNDEGLTEKSPQGSRLAPIHTASQ